MATGVQKTHGRLLEFSGKGRDLKAYALVHLMEGQGYYMDENCAKIRIEKDDVLVLFPGLRHSYGADDRSHWVEQFVVFEGPIFSSLEHEGLLQRSKSVISLKGDYKWGSDFYRFISDQREGKGMMSPEMSVAELHLLLVRLLKQRPIEYSWVESAAEKMGESLSEDIMLEKVADELGISEQVFRKGFKEATGISPYQYRLRRRLEWSRDHLLKGRDKLEVIARRCGFCDHYHFSRLFKKAFGISPGAYRRSQGLRGRGRGGSLEISERS